MMLANDRIKTGVQNLDEILLGGVPRGALTVFAGSPGAGKTILSQQIIFENASPDNKALFVQTLSEPTVKTLRYLSQFDFFAAELLENESVHFVDLGDIVRNQGLEQGIQLLMEHVKRIAPAFVVIDSFKVFEDLAQSREELRKFTYAIAIQLMAWEATTFLLGEFGQNDLENNPLFSIVDGLIQLTNHEESGEEQRFIQVIKMRGTNHSRAKHPFSISDKGLSIYVPDYTIRYDPNGGRRLEKKSPERIKTGITSLDSILGQGIPVGSSLLISGTAGTGKTLLCLEFVYRGARDFGEKGIIISFEETEERLLEEARGMGMDLAHEIKRGLIEIVFIPQPDILIEKDLLMIHERIEQLKAKRVVIDSISTFVYKVKDVQTAREKFFQLATLIQMTGSVGFFATDIPYGSLKISRFGVEEAVMDGVILLTANESGCDRERGLEVYKLRNTDHVSGRHQIKFQQGGIVVSPKQNALESDKSPNPASGKSGREP